jgi:hypothetical protein
VSGRQPLCALEARLEVPDACVVAPCAWAVMLIATSNAGTITGAPRKTRWYLI